MSSNTTSQRGFILMDQLASVTGAAMVLLSLTALVVGSSTFLARMDSKLAFNKQARQAYSIILDGGKDIKGGPGNDGSPYAYGLRSRKGAFGKPVTNYRIDLTTNGITIKGDQVSPETLDCVAKYDPVGECNNAGDSFTIDGWIDGDFTLFEDNLRSSHERTTEVYIRLISPELLKDGSDPAIRLSESYRNIASLNREIADP